MRATIGKQPTWDLHLLASPRPAINLPMTGLRCLLTLAILVLLAGCRDDGWGQDVLTTDDLAGADGAAAAGFPFPAPLTRERFPARDPVIDRYSAEFYGMLLRQAGEPALGIANANRARVSSAIRFIWTPSFHHFVIVRIEQDGHGYRLIAHRIPQMLSPRAVPQSITRPLTEREAADLHRLLDSSRIRYEPSEDPERPGLDGAGWLIELADGDHYLLVNRWSPEGGPVRQVGEAMLRLTPWQFGDVY